MAEAISLAIGDAASKYLNPALDQLTSPINANWKTEFLVRKMSASPSSLELLGGC